MTLLSDGVVDRAPDPLVCPTCKGEGRVAVRPDCIHAGSNGRCPCGPDEVPCPDCEGSGVKACATCGNEADRLGADGEPYCSFLCGGIQDENDEPDDDSYDY